MTIGRAIGYLPLLALAGCPEKVVPVPGHGGPQLYETRTSDDGKALEIATQFCATKRTGVEIAHTLCIGPSPFYFRCVGPVGRNPNEMYLDPEQRENLRKFCATNGFKPQFCTSLEIR
jgi:hypothetical protein